MRSNWSDEELSRVRELRKAHAQQEGNANLSKDIRKEHQRYVKACTIVLEYFYGTGRFLKHNSDKDFPKELEDYIHYALNLL
jgi:hypothetical protein